MAQTETLSAPRNQEEFQKFITRKCEDSMQRYTYMRLIKESHYEGLFNRQFDSDLFLLICKTFIEQVFENQAFNNAVEQEFVICVLSNIFRSPQFTFVLDFLEDNEQAIINDIVHNKLNLADHYDPKLTMMKETLAEL